MPLFRKKSSDPDKMAHNPRITSINTEKKKIIAQNNQLNATKEKAESQRRVRKKAKIDRQQSRKHKDGSRARFGVHEIRFSSNSYQIEVALSNNKNKIENFLATHELSAQPLRDNKPKNITKALNQQRRSDAERARLEKEYGKLFEEQKDLQKKLKKANEYDALHSEWRQWDGSDNMPSASVKNRILDLLTKDAIPKALVKIPVIGPLVGMGLMSYNRLRLSISEVRDETRNILSGTRKKTALGRIAGMLTGSIVGAAGMGASLALVGSIFPGVGTAIGGVAGIILGSTLGAAAGGPIGVKIFNTIASRSKRLRDELDYEMSYTQLKNLRTVYGLSEDQVLKMNAYLSNQIKAEGAKSHAGKALIELKKSALEKGKQNALAKLCFYFIGQEKILRTELYNTGMEFVSNQQEKALLLKKRRTLENEKPDAIQIRQYEDKLEEYPFIKSLYQFKKENNITKSYHELVTDFFQSFSADTSNDKQAYNKHLQLSLGIAESQANKFIDLMLKEGADLPQGLNKFVNQHTLIGEDPPLEVWMNQINENNALLVENTKAFQDISNRNLQLDRDRDGVVDILKEFKRPKELNRTDQTWIYGEMKKTPKISGSIENLFQQNKENSEEISIPKDFRSFDAKGYAVSNFESDELNRANFRENMRESAFIEAIQEASRYPKDDNNEYPPQIHVINNTVNHFIDNIAQGINNKRKTNEECKKIIFELKKIEQENPALKDFTKPKISALQDIQFYLDYASISDVYSRQHLGVHQNSLLRDLFPYTEQGTVKHLKENGLLKKSDLHTITEKMHADGQIYHHQKEIEEELDIINQMNTNIKRYNESNPDKINPQPQTLSHSDINALKLADAHARATGKNTFTAQYKKYTTNNVSEPIEHTPTSVQNNTSPKHSSSLKSKILNAFSKPGQKAKQVMTKTTEPEKHLSNTKASKPSKKK